jgi:hypothetical protein
MELRKRLTPNPGPTSFERSGRGLLNERNA